MVQQRTALGKGLSSLIPGAASSSTSAEVERQGGAALSVPIQSVVANRQQPRTEFDEEKIESLAASIKESGIIQPLIVTKMAEGRYELIAGERRLRAARKVGLDKVPVIIRDHVSREAMLELAIVENIQREDLNVIEEAKSYQSLIDQFGYTQQMVADKMGKSRSAVANSMRLLHLPKVIQDDLVSGRMESGHARALLAIGDLQQQLELRERVLQSRLTVRDVEAIVQKYKAEKSAAGPAPKQKKKAVEGLSPQIKFLIEEMRNTLGTKVELRPKNDKSGQLVIEYYSLQDLDRIYRKVAAQDS